MRYVVAALLAFGFALTVPETGGAQQVREDGGGPAVRGSVAGPEVADTRRFVIPFFRSTTSGQRSGTAITLLNNSAQSCEVRVNFFRGLGAGLPVCSLTTTLAKGIAADFCTRNVGIATACNFICAPELTFDEGKAVVATADTNPCTKVGVDARVYYFSGAGSDTGVVAVSNTQVIGN